MSVLLARVGDLVAREQQLAGIQMHDAVISKNKFLVEFMRKDSFINSALCYCRKFHITTCIN